MTVRHFVRLQLPDAEAMVRRDDFAHVDELVRRWSPAWRVPPGETDAVKAAFREPGSLRAALGYYRALRHGLSPSLRRRIEVSTVAFAASTTSSIPARTSALAAAFSAPTKWSECQAATSCTASTRSTSPASCCGSSARRRRPTSDLTCHGSRVDRERQRANPRVLKRFTRAKEP